MTLVTLNDVIQPAFHKGYAVAGLVTLGWEDMRAYVEAAEMCQAPIILQAGPGCRAHTPLPILGKMLCHLAEQASVPIVVHLDHGMSHEECAQAIDCGFSSVMFDGSRLPLSENIEKTAAVVEMAHRAGVSCEGEIGFVGYAHGAQSSGTIPEEARQFALETAVDAMAVSVGNTHLQLTHDEQGLDEKRIREIEALSDVPLVIHGGSGVPSAQRNRLSKTSNICKFNIGTELRKIFGPAVQEMMRAHPDKFDRNEILSGVHEPIVAGTCKVLNDLNSAMR